VKIYTKQGDQGFSGLFDGQRVPKNHVRLECFGSVDELNSHLGLAITTCRHDGFARQLQALQSQLLTLGADLATPPGTRDDRITRIGLADATALEQQIDAATAQLPPLKRFILPGGGATACHLHVARTVCRRAERLVAGLLLSDAESVSPHVLIYLNRLSDLLFTLARLANKLDGLHDVEWVQPAAT